MSLFNFFRKNDEEVPQMSLPEINREVFIDETEPTNSVNVSDNQFSSGKPIDSIYTFLQKDYEEEGYEDALVVSDIKDKERNIGILQSQLEVLFKKVERKYNDDLLRYDTELKSCGDAGLTDTVERIKAEKEIIGKHLKEIERMKGDLANKASYMLFSSYEKGFLKGIASKSLETLKI